MEVTADPTRSLDDSFQRGSQIDRLACQDRQFFEDRVVLGAAADDDVVSSGGERLPELSVNRVTQALHSELGGFGVNQHENVFRLEA